uniref:Protein krueppel n=1 Tax=Anopheles farauti TaxID=69004 RepID=A0A182QMK1_9DIPT
MRKKSGSVCRFCLSGAGKLSSIFHHPTIDIPNIVRVITELKVSASDPYSNLICNKCTGIISSIVEFRTRCIDSFKKSVKMLPSSAELNEPKEREAKTLQVEFIECDPPTEYLDDYVKEENYVMESDADMNQEPSISVDTAGRHSTKLEEQQDQEEKTDTDEQIKSDVAETVICAHCGEEFSGKKSLNYHVKSDHADDDKPKIRKCLFCPKTYSSYHLLEYHLYFHPQKVWHCPYCDKETMKKALFIDHLRVHANEEFYNCEDCNKSFPALKQLTVHNRTHQARRGGNRDSKAKGTTNSGKRGRPAKSVPKVLPPPNPVTYDCEVCGMKLKTKSNYTNHRKSHDWSAKEKKPAAAEDTKSTSRRVYLCNICGQHCKSSSNLTVHIRRHIGQFICECSVCGKGFPRRSDLEMHMRKHTGEKPFICSTCGRTFSRLDRLRIHTRTHTGEKPYQCPCGRAYAQVQVNQVLIPTKGS